MNVADYVSVYDRVCDEILNYINNKPINVNNIEFNIINFDGGEIDETILIEDYIIVDYLDEDKIDEYLKNKQFNYREDSIVSFNISIYLRENLKSYSYDAHKIWDQFNVDCPRSLIKINNRRIYNDIDLMNALSNIKSYVVKTKHFVLNLTTIIAMLCNQSSYAFPYIFLNKVTTDIDPNIIASNCPDNRSISIETIVDDKHRLRLKIWIKTDVIMRNIKTNQIDTKANISLLLETNSLESYDLDILFKRYGLFFYTFYSDK